MFVGSFSGTKTGYYVVVVKKGKLVSEKDFTSKLVAKSYESEYRDMLMVSGLTTNCVEAFIAPELWPECVWLAYFYHSGEVWAKVIRYAPDESVTFKTVYRTRPYSRSRQNIISLADELCSVLEVSRDLVVCMTAHAMIQVKNYHASYVTTYFDTVIDEERVAAPYVYISRYTFKQQFEKVVKLFERGELIFLAEEGLGGGVVILKSGGEMKVFTLDEFKQFLG